MESAGREDSGSPARIFKRVDVADAIEILDELDGLLEAGPRSSAREATMYYKRLRFLLSQAPIQTQRECHTTPAIHILPPPLPHPTGPVLRPVGGPVPPKALPPTKAPMNKALPPNKAPPPAPPPLGLAAKSVKAAPPMMKSVAIPPTAKAAKFPSKFPQPSFPDGAKAASVRAPALASAEPDDTDLVLPPVPEGFSARPLQWLPVIPKKMAGTIWEILAKEKEIDASIQVPIQALMREFFQKEKAPEAEKLERVAVAAAAAAKASVRVASVLDGKRSQNLEIALKGFGLLNDFSPIRSIVADLNLGLLNPSSGNQTAGEDPKADRPKTKCVTAETLQLLAGLYPRPDEEKDLMRLEAEAADRQIAPADKFLLEVMKIPRFVQRIQSIIARASLERDIQTINDKIERLYGTASKSLHSCQSGHFLRLVALLRKCGNFINSRSKKGKMRGFRINGLEPLRTYKSVDGRSSLLRVIVEDVETNMPAVWEDVAWLRDAGEQLEYRIEEFETLLKAHGNTINVITNEVKFAQEAGDANFTSLFEPFVENTRSRLAECRTTIAKTVSCLAQIAQLFAESGQTPTEGMQVLKALHLFVKDLDKTREDLIRSRTAEAAKVAKTEKRSPRKSTDSSLRHSHSEAIMKKRNDGQSGMIPAIRSLSDAKVTQDHPGCKSASVGSPILSARRAHGKYESFVSPLCRRSMPGELSVNRAPISVGHFSPKPCLRPAESHDAYLVEDLLSSPNLRILRPQTGPYGSLLYRDAKNS